MVQEVRYMALKQLCLIFFSKTYFYTHVQRYTAAAGTACYKTINDTFPEICYVKDYESAKLVNLP